MSLFIIEFILKLVRNILKQFNVVLKPESLKSVGMVKRIPILES